MIVIARRLAGQLQFKSCKYIGIFTTLLLLLTEKAVSTTVLAVCYLASADCNKTTRQTQWAFSLTSPHLTYAHLQ